jgi:hypothetical protein
VEKVEARVEELVLAELDRVATQTLPDSSDRDLAVEDLQLARRDLDQFRRDTAARRKLGELWHDTLDGYLATVREAESRVEQLTLEAGVVTEGLTRDHYLSLPRDARREVLAGFIDAVMVRRSRGRGRHVDSIESRTRVLWRGQAPGDLPRPRVSSPIVPFDFNEGEVDSAVAAAENGAKHLQT